MPVKGNALIAENILLFGGGFLKHVNKTMGKVRVVLDDKIRENISLTDHSLKDLAREDHPYARRHGPRGKEIHDPYYQVHTQSGDLLSSKRSGIVEATMTAGKLEAVAYVGLDEAIAPHAKHVIYGTSKMIPRPVLEGSRKEVLGECQEIIRTNLKDMVSNFRGRQ